MRNMRTALATGVLAIVLPACSSYDEPPEVRSELPRVEEPSTEHVTQLVADHTAFAADLYRAVSASSPGNVLMSPHSITTALTMTYAGAGGNTATQMASALHITLPPDQLHEAMNALDLALESRADDAESTTMPFSLLAANSLFAQEGVRIQPAFLDTLATNYGTGVHVVDFEADAGGSLDTINGWVEHHTNGKIENLFTPDTITDRTKCVLVNALYFTAAWKVEFGDTDDQPFAGIGSVPTMHGEFDTAGYGEGERFRAAELAYDGDALALVVVLPELLPGESGDPLALLEANLTGDKLSEIMGAAHHSLVGEQILDVAMPRFKFHAGFPLNDKLQAFGMTDAFEWGLADFSGLFVDPNPFYIQHVVHKAYIDVNEHGTEAAAATGVAIGDDSAPPPPIELVVDRPFLFLIEDKPTGEILFVGRVVDPTNPGKL